MSDIRTVCPHFGLSLTEIRQPCSFCYKGTCEAGLGFARSTLSSVSEKLLRRHLNQGAFKWGADKGLWEMVRMTWPKAVFAIERISSLGTEKAGVHFSLEHYPISAPTLQLWDLMADTSIAANAWPSWFITFVTRYYPELIALDVQPYTPEVLAISAAILRRLKQDHDAVGNRSVDITGLLSHLHRCFCAEQHIASVAELKLARPRHITPEQQSN